MHGHMNEKKDNSESKKKASTLEDGTDSLSRNVGKELPL